MEVCELERRETPDDIFGLLAGTLAGGVLANVAVTAITPSQVIWGGWDPHHIRAVPAPRDAGPKGSTPITSPRNRPTLTHLRGAACPQRTAAGGPQRGTIEDPADHQEPPRPAPPLERGEPSCLDGEALFREDFLTALDLTPNGDSTEPERPAGSLARRPT